MADIDVSSFTDRARRLFGEGTPAARREQGADKRGKLMSVERQALRLRIQSDLQEMIVNPNLAGRFNPAIGTDTYKAVDKYFDNAPYLYTRTKDGGILRNEEGKPTGLIFTTQNPEGISTLEFYQMELDELSELENEGSIGPKDKLLLDALRSYMQRRTGS